MIQGFSHLQLTVADVGSAARWYADVLGVVPLVSGETDAGAYAALRHPDAGFVIGLGAGGTDEPAVVPVDHISFAVRDLDTLRAWHTRVSELGYAPGAIFDEAVSHNARVAGPGGIVVEVTAPRR